MELNKEGMEQCYLQVKKRALIDEDFRKLLIAEPAKAIEEETGVKVPDNYRIRIIDYDPAYQASFFLPPFVGENISDAELDAVAAGGACVVDFSPCGAQGCGAQK